DPLVTGVQTCALPISASPVENDHVAVQAAPVTSVSSARSRAASPSTCSRRKRRSSARCASRKRASETVSATVLHLREDALVVRRSEERRVGKEWRWGG